MKFSLLALLLALPLFSPLATEAGGCPVDMGSAYKLPGETSVYYVTDSCTKRKFKGEQDFFNYFENWDSVQTSQKETLATIPDDEVSFMPLGPRYNLKNGSVVKTPTEATIYIILHGVAYPIDSAEVFQAYRLRSSWIEDVSPELLSQFTLGETLTDTQMMPNFLPVKYSQKADIYLLMPDQMLGAGQVIRKIQSESVVQDINYRLDHVVVIPTTKKFYEDSPITGKSDLGDTDQSTFDDFNFDSFSNDSFDLDSFDFDFDFDFPAPTFKNNDITTPLETTNVMIDPSAGVYLSNPRLWPVQRIDNSGASRLALVYEFIPPQKTNDGSADDEAFAALVMRGTNQTLIELRNEAEAGFNLMAAFTSGLFQEDSEVPSATIVTTTFGGTTGFKLSLDMPMQGEETLHLRAYATVRDGMGYTFFYGAPNDEHATTLEVADQMARSFQITGNPQTHYVLNQLLPFDLLDSPSDRSTESLTLETSDFTLRNPRGWTIDDTEGNYTLRPFTTSVCADNLMLGAKCNFPFALVNVSVADSMVSDLDEMNEEFITMLKENYGKNFSLTATADTTLGSVPAKKIVYTLSDMVAINDAPLKGLTIMSLANGKTYILTYLAENSTYESQLATIQEMFQSFTFLGEPVIETSDSVETTDITLQAVDETRDHIRGSRNAPLTIVEFADIECPFCQTFHNTMSELMDNHASNVRWVYRHLPLESLHSNARTAALATECAGAQGRFWEMTDILYREAGSETGLDITRLPVFAREAGANVYRFNQCMKDKQYNERIDTHMADGFAAGAAGTPYSVLITSQGKYVPINGAQPYSVVEELVKKYVQ